MFLQALGMAAPALSSFVCLTALKDILSRNRIQLWMPLDCPGAFRERGFLKQGLLQPCPIMRMTKSEQTVQERNGVTRCLFLANRDRSCTVSRNLECSSQLGCTLEPPVNIWYTILSPSFQNLHTYRKSVADVTFHSAVHFCYFDISQTWKLLFGKVLPGWSQVLTVTTPRNKGGRFVQQIYFPLYLYCLAAIAVSLTSSLSYPLMIWPSQLPWTIMSVNELRKQVIFI